MSICPSCNRDSRCESEQGSLRCQGEAGHTGPHWADVGRSPAVLRWGMVGYGCADPACIRQPGHELPHRNGNGMSWVPEEPSDSAETPCEHLTPDVIKDQYGNYRCPVCGEDLSPAATDDALIHCPDCGGAGYRRFRPDDHGPSTCLTCVGTGRVNRSKPSVGTERTPVIDMEGMPVNRKEALTYAIQHAKQADPRGNDSDVRRARAHAEAGKLWMLIADSLRPTKTVPSETPGGDE